MVKELAIGLMGLNTLVSGKTMCAGVKAILPVQMAVFMKASGLMIFDTVQANSHISPEKRVLKRPSLALGKKIG